MEVAWPGKVRWHAPVMEKFEIEFYSKIGLRQDQAFVIFFNNILSLKF